MAPKAKSGITHTTTAVELREQLEISESSLKRYLKDGLPHVGTGRHRRFHLGEVVKWLRENNVTGIPGRPPEPASDELQRLKCLKERALIRKYNRESMVAEGRLLDVEDVIKRYKKLGIELRQRMTELPMRILMTMELGLDHGQKNRIHAEIQEMTDDVLRKTDAAMQQHTALFSAMTLDEKPLEIDE